MKKGGIKRLNSRERCLFNKKMIWLGMLPGIILYVCFCVLPSIGTFAFSFTDISMVPGKPVHFVGLDNYKEILFLNNSRDMMQALRNTFVYSIVTTVVQTALSLFLAVCLCRKFVHGKNFYRSVVFLPTVLGVTVTGLCFKLLFSTDGLAQIVLNAFGKSSAFFGDPKLVFGLAIFCQIWASLGYEMVIFIAGLQTISDDLYEAAAIDGASDWKAFWSITLPQLWPTVMVNLLICIVGSLSSFQMILVTTGGNPAARNLAMFIYSIAFGIGAGNKSSTMGRQGVAAAMQMILFVIILGVTLFSQYVMNKFNKED